MRIIEVWKPIKNYGGLYEVSNLGNVKSLNHKRTNNHRGGSYIQKGKILKLGLNKTTGYFMVSLSKEGKTTTKYVHKLVAETFLDNKNNYRYINHKDENKLNNRIDNLEFCTQKHNCNHGTRNKRIAQKLSKKINQYDLQGNFIKTWQSSISIERALKIDQSDVCLCCKGKRKTVGGYKWKYAETK